LEIFNQNGGLLEGHFKLSSGLHSPKYLQCALVLKNPPVAEKLCKELANFFKEDKIGIVAGPALGGIIVSYELARQLGVPSIFTERDKDGVMALRRGFSIKKGARILLCEDVVTTGKSLMETEKVIENLGGKVIAIAALIDRSDNTDFGVKFKALAKIQIPSYLPENCPLCKQGLPITKPGSRPK
jgi:orotate phosphoribosyltransferase